LRSDADIIAVLLLSHILEWKRRVAAALSGFAKGGISPSIGDFLVVDGVEVKLALGATAALSDDVAVEARLGCVLRDERSRLIPLLKDVVSWFSMNWSFELERLAG
jgi:hypothetical protein